MILKVLSCSMQYNTRMSSGMLGNIAKTNDLLNVTFQVMLNIKVITIKLNKKIENTNSDLNISLNRLNKHDLSQKSRSNIDELWNIFPN